MILLPARLRFALNANGLTGRIHAARDERFDPRPVVKFFNPVGAATWLATEIDEDGDTLFGLADLGFGCPELGCFSLREIEAVRLPFSLAIERDEHIDSLAPLSEWADMARRLGTIIQAEAALRRLVRDAGALEPHPHRVPTRAKHRRERAKATPKAPTSLRRPRWRKKTSFRQVRRRGEAARLRRQAGFRW